MPHDEQTYAEFGEEKVYEDFAFVDSDGMLGGCLS